MTEKKIKLIASGCSQTWGDWLPDVRDICRKHIRDPYNYSRLAWPTKLAEMNDWNYANVSQCGLSNDTISNKLIHFIETCDNLDDSPIVCVVWTEVFRRSFKIYNHKIVDDIRDIMIDNFSYLHEKNQFRPERKKSTLDDMLENYFDENFELVSLLTEIKKLSGYLKSKNIQLFYHFWSSPILKGLQEMEKHYSISMLDPSRLMLIEHQDQFVCAAGLYDIDQNSFPRALDGNHLGVSTHLKIAEGFDKKIKSLIGDI